MRDWQRARNARAANIHKMRSHKIKNSAHVELMTRKLAPAPGLFYVVTDDGHKMFFDGLVDLACLYDRYTHWNTRIQGR